MSLINDALKRAKAAQRPEPPPALSGPPLRPVDPERTHLRQGVGLALPVTLALLALLMLFFVWRTYQRGAALSTPEETSLSQETSGQRPGQAVRAREAQATESVPMAAAPMKAGQSRPATVSEVSAPPAQLSGPVAQNPAPGAPVQVANAVAAVSTAAISESNAGPAVVQSPKPAPPRLQGIVFSPKRPSVVINGKTLFVGDRFGALRVVSIRPDGVTLVGSGQTNVLTIEE